MGLHTIRRIPANEGYWISLNLRGHVDVHKTKPMKTNIIQEMGASFLFVAMAILVIVVVLAM
jgi:hypothetical protein